jgi:hypothetical protein
MVAVWIVEAPVAVIVTAYEPAERVPGPGPLGSVPPLPQPLRTPRVTSATSRVRRRGSERRRYARRTRSPVSVIVRPVPPALTMEFAGEMVSVVVRASGPEGVRVDGLKVHVAPEGKPPVQANLMVEWKPSVGLMLRVMGFEALP